MENNENNGFPTLENAGEEIKLPKFDETPVEVDEKDVIRANGEYDDGEEPIEEPAPSQTGKFTRSLFDFVEMLALVTVVIVLCFAFVFRLNVVDGPSMENTLHTGEYLLVSDLFYDPTPGDIVVVHDVTVSERYREPLVKRVIATEGQTVDIDFETWTVTVDGVPVDESEYVYIDKAGKAHSSDISYPFTVEEGKVFVMGDNRHHSADSRISAIGQIDERCIVGKVYARLSPINKFKIFTNPHN